MTRQRLARRILAVLCVLAVLWALSMLLLLTWLLTANTWTPPTFKGLWR
jgi:hypothetical protein